MIVQKIQVEATMTTNLSRYEDDLKRLVEHGNLLLRVMQYEQNKDELTKHLTRTLGDKAQNYIEKIPRFSSEYQIWYSEAKALIRQVIPHRLDDFVRHYERKSDRKSLEWDNYTIEDYLQGLAKPGFVSMTAGIARMEQQLNILRSAERRFQSSLFDIRQLVAADFFDNELSSARALAKSKFLRAAGAIAGVVLEKHLTQICENHGIKLKKKTPTISDINDSLKNSDIIDIPQWRTIQFLGDIRNICDHNKSKEPTDEQIQDLIDGVEKLIKTVF